MCTYHSCLLHFLPPQRKFFRPLHWSANMKKNSACAVCSQHRLHHLQSAPSAVCTFCSLHCLHHLQSAWSAPSAVYTVCSLHHLQSAWSAPSAVCTICSLHSLQSAWSALWCDRLGSGQATVVIQGVIKCGSLNLFVYRALTTYSQLSLTYQLII